MKQQEEYDFVVTLKHPGFKAYNLITVLMCVLTIAASVFALLQYPFVPLSWVNIALMGIIIFNLSMGLRSRDADTIPTFKWALYAAAFLWLLYPLHLVYISIFFIVAALLERQIKFPQEIGFSREAITFNTFPFKHYEWEQVKNVMLKDNMLTIDFKNNKLIQREIEPAELTEEETEFNEFCRRQMVQGQ